MKRRETPLDAAVILQTLDRYGVDYVLIGGLAVQAHGHVRTTQDVDLFPDAATENLEHLVGALSDLRARPVMANVQHLLAAETHVLDTPAGGLDVHLKPPGSAPWIEVRRRAMVLEVVGTTVPVAGRDDLIAMKRAAGRPIDRGDIIALTEPDPQ
ncbi:MAG: nucleotidyltransferase [Actinomycetota bacterium]|nr:nucleotidyltransferase [Actinomycetota bacterium]